MEIIFYIDEPITSKVATLEMIPRDTELILLDFIVKKYKMALYAKYEKCFLVHRSETLGLTHGKTILIGDLSFSVEK